MDHIEMKWKYYPIPIGDARAKSLILENMKVGQVDHSLTRKLWAHFADAGGSILLIAFDTIDVDGESLYEFATYCGGKPWYDAAGTDQMPVDDCPIRGMTYFIMEFLQSENDSIVVFEDFIATRTSLATWRPRESRVCYFQEEVYYLLTSDDKDVETIECAIRDSQHHFGIGVCSSCEAVPDIEVFSEGFFDEIVAKARHIFSPALDGEGFLIWSPPGPH